MGIEFLLLQIPLILLILIILLARWINKKIKDDLYYKIEDIDLRKDIYKVVDRITFMVSFVILLIILYVYISRFIKI